MVTIRRGEDAGMSRRSLRLLCGGWLPHDDGASEGCLALATNVGVFTCPTRSRGFPLPRPASSRMREMSFRSGAKGDALSDRPDEPEQFSGHCGGGDDGSFSSVGEPVIGLVQPQLRLPCKRVNVLRNWRAAFLHPWTDLRRAPVIPCGLAQHGTRDRAACFGDPTGPDRAAATMFPGCQAE